MWEVRVGQFVGGNNERRDFEVQSRGGKLSSVQITGTLPWRRGVDERDEERRCVDLLLEAVREIAAQDELPIRR